MRILSVADFNWMTGAERDSASLSLFDICRKLSFAATRAGHLVVEFSDRAVARQGAVLRIKELGAGWANRRFLQTVEEFRPDLIFLHFADGITNASLTQARRLSPGVIVADINIDPVDSPKNRKRLARRQGVADALFVTTAEPTLAQYVGSRAFAAYLPNPVDRSVESGRVFEVERPPFDLLFPAGDNRPRALGGAFFSPIDAATQLRSAVPNLRLSTPGVGGQAAARGVAYFDSLRSARIGWSLSRRVAPLYASDRMAHFFGWGLVTAMDRRSGFDRFYAPGEAIFYDDLTDLAAGLRRLIVDDAQARAIARAGWVKTWALFESGRVLTYILAQLRDDGGAKGYEWPCERWGG